MNKRNILIGVGLFIILIVGIFLLSELKKLYNIYNPSLIYETEDDIEKIYAFDYGIGVEMALEQKIDSKEELEKYRERAVERLTNFAQSHLEEEIPVQITLAKRLTTEKIKEMGDEYDLHIQIAKYRMLGTNITRGGPLEADPERIRKMNELTARSTGIPIESIEFKVVAIIAIGKTGDLVRLQEEPDIFIVDPGPIDKAEQFKDTKVKMVWNDISWEYEQYSNFTVS